MFGKTDAAVLPEKDIDQSTSWKGSHAFKAVSNNEILGGAIVNINEDTQYNFLDFLFVKAGSQNKGLGKFMWTNLEKIFNKTKVWETCTPYFERRNVHFYVNTCGFHIVKFYNERLPMPGAQEEYHGDDDEGMFKLVKNMENWIPFAEANE